MSGTIEAIRWAPFCLELLDQRRLPHETVYLRYHDAHGVADGIRSMVVRGAPAIGIAAAYGVCLAAAPNTPLEILKTLENHENIEVSEASTDTIRVR